MPLIMANPNKPLPLSNTYSLLLTLLLFHHTNAISRDSYCKSYRDPSLCFKVLPTGDFSDIRSFGRFSVKKSLQRSHAFHDYLVEYLRGSSAELPIRAARALEDCRGLAALNVEILTGCVETVDGGLDALLSAPAVDGLRTAMSAVVTNLDTCSDGLAEHPSLIRQVSREGGLADDARLHGLTLSLCVDAWVPKWARRPILRPRRPTQAGGKIRLKFKSEEKRKVYEAATSGQRGPGRRRVLETSDEEGVLVSNVVIVSQDGTWDFVNVSAAVAAAPKNLLSTDGYFLIYVTEGVYEENVDIPSNKKYLFLLGDGMGHTVITASRSVGDNFTTFNSATLAVTGQGFLAADLTIRNTAGPSKHQAVALRSGSDMSTFYRCSFEAYQDTLYTHSNRQFYRECDIYGTVDFIFGNAAAVLQRCNILPRLPLRGQFNAVTAQGRTDPNQNTGTSIHHCTIRAAPDLAAGDGTAKTYLGRPWKDYSRTVVMQSFLDDLVQPAGWREWSANVSQLSTLYYAEFENFGPGSDTADRVAWPGFHVIDAAEASEFTVSPFVDGDSWIPKTGVPYDEGLV